MKNSLFNRIQNNIQYSPETRRHIRAMSFLGMLASFLPLIIGLFTREHPNPFLAPSLIVIGIGGVLTGLSSLLYLRQARMAGWLMLLGWAFVFSFLYLLVRIFSYD